MTLGALHLSPPWEVRRKVKSVFSSEEASLSLTCREKPRSEELAKASRLAHVNRCFCGKWAYRSAESDRYLFLAGFFFFWTLPGPAGFTAAGLAVARAFVVVAGVVVVVVVVAAGLTVLAEVGTLFKAMISTTVESSNDPKCMVRCLGTSVRASRRYRKWLGFWVRIYLAGKARESAFLFFVTQFVQFHQGESERKIRQKIIWEYQRCIMVSQSNLELFIVRAPCLLGQRYVRWHW